MKINYLILNYIHWYTEEVKQFKNSLNMALLYFVLNHFLILSLLHYKYYTIPVFLYMSIHINEYLEQ